MSALTHSSAASNLLARYRLQPTSTLDLGDLATAMVGGGCSEVTFVVKSVICVKGRGKALRYQVKWKDSVTTSWEPITNLKGAQGAIDKFNKQK